MAAQSLGYSLHYTLALYGLVGDDIVFFDQPLANAYYELVLGHGLQISLKKSLVPPLTPIDNSIISMRNRSFTQDCITEFLSK